MRGQAAGWQIVLADLSLILFATAALDAGKTPFNATQYVSGDAPASATFQGDADFSRWLAQQADDPRQRLTISVHYAPAGRTAAVADALRLADQAQAAGFAPRIVVEPGTAQHLSASLAFDQPDRRQ